MKKSLRNILCCGALFATLTLTACGENPESKEVKNIVIANGETSIEENGVYDYSNLQLQIIKKDGSRETKRITDDMIVKKIDTSVAGDQKIVVKYDDAYYELTVKVNLNPVKQGFYDKVQSIIEQLQNDASIASSVDVNMGITGDISIAGKPLAIKIGEDDEGNPQTIGLNEINGVLALAGMLINKDIIGNDEIIKSLQLLQLNIKESGIVKDGDSAYGTVDVLTMLAGIAKIVADNSDYYVNLMLQSQIVGGAINSATSYVENWLVWWKEYEGETTLAQDLTGLITNILAKSDADTIKAKTVLVVDDVLKIFGLGEKYSGATLIEQAELVAEEGTYFEALVSVLKEIMTTAHIEEIETDMRLNEVDGGEDGAGEEVDDEDKSMEIIFNALNNVAIELDKALRGEDSEVLASLLSLGLTALVNDVEEEIAEDKEWYQRYVEYYEDDIDEYTLWYEQALQNYQDNPSDYNLGLVEDAMYYLSQAKGRLSAYNIEHEIGAMSEAIEYIPGFIGENGQSLVNKAKLIDIQLNNLIKGREVNLNTAFIDFQLGVNNFIFDFIIPSYNSYIDNAENALTKLNNYIIQAQRALATAQSNYEAYEDEPNSLEKISAKADVDEYECLLDELDDIKYYLTEDVRDSDKSKEVLQKIKSTTINFLNKQRELYVELDKLANGKSEDVAVKLVALVDQLEESFNDVMDIVSELKEIYMANHPVVKGAPSGNGEVSGEGETNKVDPELAEIQMIFDLYKQYLRPQITVDGINAIIAKLKAFENMNAVEVASVVMDDFTTFLANNNTKSFIKTVTLSPTANYLEMLALEDAINPVYDENDELQSYVVEINDLIVDFATSKVKNPKAFVVSLQRIIETNNLSTKFDLTKVNTLTAVVNLFEEEPMVAKDVSIVSGLLIEAFHLPAGQESMAKVSTLIDNFRNIYFDDELSFDVKAVNIMTEINKVLEDEKIQFAIMTFKATTGQYDSMEALMADIKTFVDNSKMIESMPNGNAVKAIIYTLLGVKGSSEPGDNVVDYNVLLKGFIQLPEMIAELDFNEFINDWQETNLGDILTIDNIAVELIEDDAGNVIGQRSTFKAKLNLVIGGLPQVIVDEHPQDVDLVNANAEFTFSIDFMY